MFKLVSGRGSLKFGSAEKGLSLNWASLAVSLVIATLTWFGVEAVPDLQERGGAIAAIAGLVAQLIPVIVMYLRSNKDITFDKPVSPPSDEKK